MSPEEHARVDNNYRTVPRHVEEGASAPSPSPLHDPINHPAHYTTHPSGIECITITRHMNFNLGNAIKYIWRAENKAGVQDLEKAVWYLQDEIARLRSKEGA